MRILVTGATGNIGRMLVDHLVGAGGCQIRALTVDPERAALPPDVEIATGYLRRPETLPAAFAGVDAMYLAPTPETTAQVVRMAERAGLEELGEDRKSATAAEPQTRACRGP